jgi:hypothetical protein
VLAFTLRYTVAPAEAERSAVGELVFRHGGRVLWQRDALYQRTYGLVEDGTDRLRKDVARIATASVLETAVIALAVVPSVAEALPPLAQALGGKGRPQGVVSCERAGDALVVEWDPQRTPVTTVNALIDVELRRYGASRVNRLLSPLPLGYWTTIAGQGLAAPEIEPERVLEFLLARAHVTD